MERVTSALLSVCVAASLLLSCSEDLKPIERETWEEYQRTLQARSSSGEAANLSSSSEVESSSSGGAVNLSSSSEAGSSSSSEEAENSSSSEGGCNNYDAGEEFCYNNSVYKKCGNENGLGKYDYNPDTQFCHNNYTIAKCGGKRYEPTEEVCNIGVVGKMCGSIWYNPQTNFCLGGISTLLCGGDEYTGSQFCRGDMIYNKCNGQEYEPTHFCSGSSILPKCGGTWEYTPGTEACCGNAKYTITTQFCYGSTVHSKCEGSDYSPDTHFCLGSTITPLCGGQTFTGSQFCHTDDKVYDKCEGTVEYNPGSEACCGNNKYTIATQFCYNSSKVGSKCGTRMEIFDPNLYECREGSKIYLKAKVKDDGNNEYDAVLIGTQTWMARNLNYNVNGSVCYENNSTDYSIIYGRLYNWSTAMSLLSNCNSSSCSNQIQTKHRGICPSGWHLPSQAEWEVMTTYIGGVGTEGKKLKATSGWNSNGNGTDDYGFSALPGGYGVPDGSFHNAGNYGHWWSASEYDSYYAYYRLMYYDHGEANWDYNYKSFSRSVRCVMD